MDDGSNIQNMSDFPRLNKVEMGAIISFLIDYNCKIDLVKERMLKVYDCRVSAETIRRILSQKEEYIKNGIQKVREDLASCHFYHLPARLREWERLYYESLKERVVNSCKTGEDEYTLVEKPDLPSAAAALRGMSADVTAYDRLLFDREKEGLDGNDDDDDLTGGAAIAAGGPRKVG